MCQRDRMGQAWRRWAGLLAAALVLLAGCASPPPAPPAGLLDDALFGHPPRPVDADAALAVDPAMRAHLRRLRAQSPGDAGRPRLLAEALRRAGDLQLEYDGGPTRTAAQAFAARSGNCLSLVLMSAALARELGLTVTYQRAHVDPAYRQADGFTLRSGHVNLLLGPRPPRWNLRSAGLDGDPDRLLVDFQPPEDLRGLRSEPITEATLLALFANNRAAEALQHGAAALAYAWTREALRHDPGLGAAYNTLGVVYRQAGHAAAAAAAFRALLAREPDNPTAMWNLARLLQARGSAADLAEAADWDARRRRLEPVAPFAQLEAGRAALARGDVAAARALFAAELALTGPTAGLHLLLAQAQHRLGEAALARQSMQQAIALSDDPAQRTRYAAKLAWLRAQSGAETAH